MTKETIEALLKSANGVKKASTKFKQALSNLAKAEDFVERGKASLAKHHERQKAAEKRAAAKKAKK